MKILRLASCLAPCAVAFACVLEPETCDDEESYIGEHLPPTKYVALSEVTPGSGYGVRELPADAGPDARVLVTVGKLEDWTTMTCENACRRLKREGYTTTPHVFTTCSFEKERDGRPWLRCNYGFRRCRDYE